MSVETNAGFLGKLGDRFVFNGAGLWSFNNDFAQNVIVFGVDNSPWRHSENSKIKINIISRMRW